MSNTSEQQNNSVPFIFRFIATGFFSGYSPIAPGTVGSLIGLALYLIPGFENYALMLAIIPATFLIGAVVSKQMETQFGEDPSIVVIDEIVGMWISLLFLPKSFSFFMLAFLFFRIYDIFKPPPARRFESIGHGFGIMLDDVVAGIYSNITVRIFVFLFPFLIE